MIYGVSKIDSIKIYKIDTISDFLYAAIRQAKLFTMSKTYLKTGYEYGDMVKEKKYQANEAYNNAHMELYTPDEESFRKQEMNIYNRRTDEGNHYLKEAQKCLDTIRMIQTELNKVNKKLADKKTQRHNFLGYYIRFRLLGSDKDNNELKLDSLAISLSPNLRIMQFDKL